jgi:hypothetical protein
MRLASSAFTFKVRNRRNGSTAAPGGIHFVNAASISGVYGGSSGLIRGVDSGMAGTLPSRLLRFSQQRYRFLFRSAAP